MGTIILLLDIFAIQKHFWIRRECFPLKIRCSICKNLCLFKVPFNGYEVKCVHCHHIIVNLYNIKIFRVFNFTFIVFMITLTLAIWFFLRELLGWNRYLIIIIVALTNFGIFNPIHNAISYHIYKTTNKSTKTGDGSKTE